MALEAHSKSPRAGRVIKCANEKSFNVFLVITTLSEGELTMSAWIYYTQNCNVAGSVISKQSTPRCWLH